jgi:hypothetical protein
MVKHISYKYDVVATVLHKKRMVDATWFQAVIKNKGMDDGYGAEWQTKIFEKDSDILRAKLT